MALIAAIGRHGERQRMAGCAVSVAGFLAAVLALLLAPGPTNMLVALAGARRGAAAAVRLIPAELGGYLATILPLALIGGDALARAPHAAALFKIVAAAWVLFLAVRLWDRRAQGGPAEVVTARRVWLTTMLNPKALIVGLVLLPAPASARFRTDLALFVLSVIAVATAWAVAGSLARAGQASGRRLRLIQRAASIWLAIVSATLVAGAVAA